VIRIVQRKRIHLVGTLLLLFVVILLYLVLRERVNSDLVSVARQVEVFLFEKGFVLFYIVRIVDQLYLYS
jgi:hypothetical protein